MGLQVQWQQLEHCCTLLQWQHLPFEVLPRSTRATQRRTPGPHDAAIALLPPMPAGPWQTPLPIPIGGQPWRKARQCLGQVWARRARCQLMEQVPHALAEHSLVSPAKKCARCISCVLFEWPPSPPLPLDAPHGPMRRIEQLHATPTEIFHTAAVDGRGTDGKAPDDCPPPVAGAAAAHPPPTGTTRTQSHKDAPGPTLPGGAAGTLPEK